MATITASIERSLQNCSLNQTTRTRPGGGDGGVGWSSSSSSSSSSDSPESIINHQINTNNSKNNNNSNNNRRSSTKKEEISTQQSNVSSSDDNSTFVELNSHVSLPYHWEQCLDLKTGEIYYINWSNGMKAKEDPRTTATGYNGDYYSEDEDEDDDDDNDDDDDEEESNCYDSESSSTELSPCWNNRKEYNLKSMMKHHQQQELNQDSVLVVAGCKGCLMYYMVPKQVEDCPKCSGQLLHFAANNSSP